MTAARIGNKRSAPERLLPIRAAIMGQLFEQKWQKAYKPPEN